MNYLLDKLVASWGWEEAAEQACTHGSTSVHPCCGWLDHIVFCGAAHQSLRESEMCTLGHRSNTSSSDSIISPSALNRTISTDTDCYRKQRWKGRQTDGVSGSIIRWSIDLDPMDRPAGLPSWSDENEWLTMNRHDSQTTTENEAMHINYVRYCVYVRVVEGITLLYP
jgi:hypothetical protein